MATFDKTYHHILREILEYGYSYEDPNREGVKRKELEFVALRHDLLRDGFPALTTKEAYFKGAVGEMLFFLSGSTDIRDLWKHGVRFWDKDWARFHRFTEEKVKEYYQLWKKGYTAPDAMYDMGMIYPKQYRDFRGVDQLRNLVTTLKNNPMSTSLIVSAWNPADLAYMCLPPCHYGFQVVARPLKREERTLLYQIKEKTEIIPTMAQLNLSDTPLYGFTIYWEQRSTDFFLGTPVNIMFYSLVAMMLEKVTGHVALAVQGNLKNVHLYDNQFEAVEEQLKRDPDKYGESFVTAPLTDKEFWQHDIDTILHTLEVSDFVLNNYQSYPSIKVDMLSYK